VKWFCLKQTDHLCKYQTKKQKQKYYIVGTVTKYNRKIVERGKKVNKYMTATFPDLAQTLR